MNFMSSILRLASLPLLVFLCLPVAWSLPSPFNAIRAPDPQDDAVSPQFEPVVSAASASSTPSLASPSPTSQNNLSQTVIISTAIGVICTIIVCSVVFSAGVFLWRRRARHANAVRLAALRQQPMLRRSSSTEKKHARCLSTESIGSEAGRFTPLPAYVKRSNSYNLPRKPAPRFSGIFQLPAVQESAAPSPPGPPPMYILMPADVSGEKGVEGEKKP